MLNSRNRPVTQRSWDQRPEQADQTVKVLEALGFSVQLGYMDQEFDKNGTLVSEIFTKNTLDGSEKVTVDYRHIRTYLCDGCNRICLVADKQTHGDYHERGPRPDFDYDDYYTSRYYPY